MNNVRQDRLAHILRYLDKEEDAAVSWRHRVFFHVLEWEFHEQAEKSRVCGEENSCIHFEATLPYRHVGNIYIYVYIYIFIYLQLYYYIYIDIILCIHRSSTQQLYYLVQPT